MASSRWAENNTKRRRWWNEMLMSLKLQPAGTIPPVFIPLNIKETKITMYTASETCAAADITVSSFSPACHGPSRLLYICHFHARTLALMGQTSPVFLRAQGERDRTASCLRCRFIMRHQLFSFEGGFSVIKQLFILWTAFVRKNIASFWPHLILSWLFALT